MLLGKLGGAADACDGEVIVHIGRRERIAWGEVFAGRPDAGEPGLIVKPVAEACKTNGVAAEQSPSATPSSTGELLSPNYFVVAGFSFAFYFPLTYRLFTCAV